MNVVKLPMVKGDIAKGLRVLADIVAKGKDHPKLKFVACVVMEQDGPRFVWTTYGYGQASPLEVMGAFALAAQNLTIPE